MYNKPLIFVKFLVDKCMILFIYMLKPFQKKSYTKKPCVVQGFLYDNSLTNIRLR